MASTPSSSTSSSGLSTINTSGTAVTQAETAPTENGSVNGSEYGAGPSVYHYSQPPFDSHNQEIVNHLYHAGFHSGHYSDTVLHVLQHVYGLHAIILSRSPYLVHMMSTAPIANGQRMLYVDLSQEPEVTQEGFAIALGYLYSSHSLNLVRPENARAVLAAGCFLDGMDDLCSYAYEICKRSICLENIRDWLSFIAASSPPPEGGDASPSVPLTRLPNFEQYAQRLKDDVFDFLVTTLPASLDMAPNGTAPPTPISPTADLQSPSLALSASNGRQTMLQIYSLIPFEMFKAAIESPALHIGLDQARFKFAKDAIELRKRGIARGTGAEEAVVLAFGGQDLGGSAVHVTRKLRRRPLWKVNS